MNRKVKAEFRYSRDISLGGPFRVWEHEMNQHQVYKAINLDCRRNVDEPGRGWIDDRHDTDPILFDKYDAAFRRSRPPSFSPPDFNQVRPEIVTRIGTDQIYESIWSQLQTRIYQASPARPSQLIVASEQTETTINPRSEALSGIGEAL